MKKGLISLILAGGLFLTVSNLYSDSYTSDVLAVYDFENNTDDSKNSYDLTTSGDGGYFSSTYKKYGSYGWYNDGGSSDHLVFPTELEEELADCNVFTIELHHYVPTQGTNIMGEDMISRGSGSWPPSAGDLLLQLSASDSWFPKEVHLWFDDSYNTYTFSSYPSPGWHHWKIIWNNGTLELWFDGTMLFTEQYVDNPFDTAAKNGTFYAGTAFGNTYGYYYIRNGIDRIIISNADIGGDETTPVPDTPTSTITLTPTATETFTPTPTVTMTVTETATLCPFKAWDYLSYGTRKTPSVFDIKAYDNKSYFAYIGTDEKLYLKVFENGSWQDVGGSIENYNIGATISLDIFEGVPYIAYRKTTNIDRVASPWRYENCVRLKKFNGTTWEQVGGDIDKDWNYYMWQIKLKISNETAEGVPYISYAFSSTPSSFGKAKVTKFNGTSWELLGGTYCSANTIYDSDFDVYDAIPFIAYRETGGVTVKKFDSSWVTLGTANFLESRGLSFEVNSEDGIPYLANISYDWPYELNVYKFVANQWNSLGQINIANSSATDISLGIGQSNIYCAYTESISGLYSTYVKKYNNTTQEWDSVGNDEVSTGNHGKNILSVEADVPYISFAYLYGYPSYEYPVMKYDCYPLPTPTNTPLPCIYPNSSFGTNGIVIHDNAAGGSGDDYAYAMVKDSNGKIYIAGSSHNSENQDMAVWSYNADGTLNISFNSTGIRTNGNLAGSGDDVATGIAIGPNNKLYICGYSENDYADYDMAIWSLNLDGTDNTTFNNGKVIVGGTAGGDSDDAANDIVVDSSGVIYATGMSVNSAGDSDMVVWKYSSTGVASTPAIHDSAAGGDSDDSGYSITIDNNGKVLVTGYSYNPDSGSNMTIWRYNQDLNVDNTFGNNTHYVTHNSAAGSNGDDTGYDIITDNSGRIVVAGASMAYNGMAPTIWRYMNGTIDPSFGWYGYAYFINTPQNGVFTSLKSDNCNNYYVSGLFEQKNTIWKIRNNGVLDTSFNNGAGRYSDTAGGSQLSIGNAISLDVVSSELYLTLAGIRESIDNFDIFISKYNDECYSCIYATPTMTATITPTRTATKTITRTVTETRTSTVTKTITETRTITPTITESPTKTGTRTATSTRTESPTSTNTRTITLTRTASPTRTSFPTFTFTPTMVPTNSTMTVTRTITATRTVTATKSETSTRTVTKTITTTSTITETHSVTPTRTATPTKTATRTITSTHSVTETKTTSATFTPINTRTVTPTITHTRTITQTRTVTPTRTATMTHSHTRTITLTWTHSPTFTVTATRTVTPTITETHTYTANTPTPTATHDSNTIPRSELYGLSFFVTHNNCNISKEIEFNIAIRNHSDRAFYNLEKLKLRYWYSDEAISEPDIVTIDSKNYQSYYLDRSYQPHYYSPCQILTGDCLSKIQRQISEVDIGMQNKVLDITMTDTGAYLQGKYGDYETYLYSGVGSLYGGSSGSSCVALMTVFDLGFTIKKDTTNNYYINQGNDWSHSWQQTGLITVYIQDDTGVWWEMYGQEPVTPGVYNLVIDSGGYGVDLGTELYKRDRRYAKGAWGVEINDNYCYAFDDKQTAYYYRAPWIYENFDVTVQSNPTPGATPTNHKVYQSILQNWKTSEVANFPLIYKFDNLPNGDYNLTLMFAQIDPNITGNDVQKIYINNEPEPRATIDILNTVGANVAQDWTTQVSVTDGTLKLKYEAAAVKSHAQGCLAGIKLNLQSGTYKGMSPKIKPVPQPAPTEIPEITPIPNSVTECGE